MGTARPPKAIYIATYAKGACSYTHKATDNRHTERPRAQNHVRNPTQLTAAKRGACAAADLGLLGPRAANLGARVCMYFYSRIYNVLQVNQTLFLAKRYQQR
jgi:hypothetical protein